jgi:putative PIN family toxin of toxin-antitoxin system
MKVVFDTNVVASASFWRGTPFDCLKAWAEGGCEAVVSPALLAEYQETTEELRLEYPERPFVPWAEALAESAGLVFPTDRATGATPDPADEMVLECALAAEADFIVSGDKKHLLPLREFGDIPIVSPTEFLRRLKSS